MSVKKINPNGLCVKTLKICYLSTGGGGFLTVVSEMAERRYSIEWKVYNSKDYGVPQNRERVYIVGRTGERCTKGLLPIRRTNTAILNQIIGGSQGMRVYDPNNISCTLSSQGGGMGAKTGLYKITDLYSQRMRIRKLTPKECFRLQGFTDEQFEKAAAVNSNSQLYKQAGNAVTVNVVEEIGKHIMSVENGA